MYRLRTAPLFRAPSRLAEDQWEGDLLHEFMQKYAKDAYHVQPGEEKLCQ